MCEELKSDKLTELLKLAVIFQFHSTLELDEYQLSPNFGKVCLSVYVGASSLKHSCVPNCVWHSDGKGFKCIRAIVPISQGDELTVDRCGETYLAKPTPVRQALLRENWEILCDCSRCTDSAGDRTRQFYCFNTKCLGYHLVRSPQQQRAEDPAATAELLPCNVCGIEAPPSYQQNTFRLEQSMALAVDRLSSSSCRRDSPELLSLQPLSPYHHLTHQIASAQALARDDLNPNKAIDLACEAHNALAIIAHHPTLSLAACTHAVGLAYETSACGGAMARKYLSKAVQTVLLLRGRESRNPAYDEALLRVMSALPPDDLAFSPTRSRDIRLRCSFCAVDDASGVHMTLKLCGRCMTAQYCSQACQKIHWPLHRKQCRLLCGQEGEVDQK